MRFSKLRPRLLGLKVSVPFGFRAASLCFGVGSHVHFFPFSAALVGLQVQGLGPLSGTI